MGIGIIRIHLLFYVIESLIVNHTVWLYLNALVFGCCLRFN